MPPPPAKETRYDYTPPPPPPQERYVYTPPPQEGYVYTPPCHHYNTRPKQRNRTLFTRRTTRSCLKYTAEDFRITSCRGPILLPA